MKLITITGPSAAGKTTLLRKLEQVTNVQELKGYTTRAPRDENDENYEFITHEDFERDKETFCEIIELYGDMYGRKWNDILDIVNNKKIPVAIVSPEGIEIYKKVCKTLGLEHITVWLGGEKSVLKERQLQRVTERLGNLSDELAWYKKHNWDIVINSFTKTTQNKVLQNLNKYLGIGKKLGRVWT